MLFAPRAGGTSAGFLIGWVVGIVVAVVVFVLIAGATDLGSTDQPSALGAWIKLILGLALIALAVRQWRGRPRPGEAAKLPAWMSAIDSMTPGRAAGLGVLLSAVNPKNLAMAVGAGTAIAAGGLGGGGTAAAVAVFTMLAASTVAVPVIGYAVAAQRMRGPLDRLKTWLEANNAAVMGVLLLIIGLVLAGKGIGGLF
jgi:threonine/homoserine/homoserine lactone efflux protein